MIVAVLLNAVKRYQNLAINRMESSGDNDSLFPVLRALEKKMQGLKHTVINESD